MTLPQDSKEFIALLNAAGVEYLIVGGHAMAYYGLPRSTGDLDFFVGTCPQNAGKICHALNDFGFASAGCKPDDFTVPDNVIQLGFAPNRIDILTSIDASILMKPGGIA